MTHDTDQEAQWLTLGHHLADVARQATLKHFRDPTQAVIAKQGEALGSAHFDPVTEADRGAEQRLRTIIEKEWPEFGLLGEEFGTLRPDADLYWVLDPIDGTRSFVCGLPTWTTLLGLAERNQPILGIVDQPFIGERWFASSEGAYWVRQMGEGISSHPIPIHCRSCARIEDACLATTDPRPGVMFSEQQAAGFDHLARRARVVRFSTDAYGYVLIASGNLDLVIESGLHPYDIAAVIPLVVAAGGIATDWKGRPIRLNDEWDGTIVAAGDSRVHAAALDAIAGW